MEIKNSPLVRTLHTHKPLTHVLTYKPFPTQFLFSFMWCQVVYKGPTVETRSVSHPIPPMSLLILYRKREFLEVQIGPLSVHLTLNVMSYYFRYLF